MVSLLPPAAYPCACSHRCSRVFAAGETALDAALKVKLPHHTGTHHAKGHTQHHQKKTDLLRLLHDDL